MSQLKVMEQQLVKAGGVKGMLQLGWVKDRAVKNYQATTGRKDAENWFQQEAFAMMSIMAERPDLMTAEPLSIIGALVKAGTLGLRISDGHVDLIKYGKILKAEPNYKGHREQLRKMETVQSVEQAQLVFTGDVFLEDKLKGIIIKHESSIPKAISMETIVAAYVRVTFKDGTIKDVVVYHDELVKARSKSKNKTEEGPWNQFPGEMCRKVAIHRANKNYYRRPDHEVMVDPIEGEVDPDDTMDVAHEEQASAPDPVQEVKQEPVKETKPKKEKIEEAKVVKKTETDEAMEEYLKNN